MQCLELLPNDYLKSFPSRTTVISELKQGGAGLRTLPIQESYKERVRHGCIDIVNVILPKCIKWLGEM